nr:hypothetical protein [uncultured Carboxylicivirga sp.]
MKKQHWIFITIVGISVFLTSCLPGGGNYSPDSPAGFFTGIWHGWIAPFSLIMGLFNSSITIYESFNTGWWYDFGFYMAIIAGFGSLQLVRKKKR